MSKWTIDKMITVERAEHVARKLFPDEYHVPGYNCRAEIGHIGSVCRYCEAKEAAWQLRITQVREAMKGAFS